MERAIILSRPTRINYYVFNASSTSSRLLKLRSMFDEYDGITKLDIFAFEIITLLKKRVMFAQQQLSQSLLHLNVDERDMNEVPKQALLDYRFIFYHGVKLAFSKFK